MALARTQMRLDFRRRRKDGRVAKRPGRKRAARRRDVPHRARPEVDPRHPVHVVLRIAPAVRSMRTRTLYHAVRVALRGCAARIDYRVVHISIQSNHLHVLVEADHKRALARGMQGFAISAAKRINRALDRAHGTVFPLRYHATVVSTPTQARNALAYVLNNWRRHRADAGAPWRVDPFSSAWQFRGWSRPHGHNAPVDPLPVVAPQTWLLREGWSRAGPIHLDEIPGPISHAEAPA